MWNKVIVFLIYFLLPTFAFAKTECKKMQLKDLNTSQIIDNKIICFDAKKNFVLSESCLKENCSLAKLAKKYGQSPKLNIDLINNGHGNPGYNLCDLLKGETHYIDVSQIFKKSKVDGLGICFLKDGSAADVGALLNWSGFSYRGK